MNVDPQRLELALERWEAAVERSERPNCDDICGGDAELAAALRQQIESLRRLEPYLELPEAIMEVRDFCPRQIGAYPVVDELARGGMGIVYRCRQEHPARNVAVKVMNPGRTNEESRRRFQLECEILAMFNHPGIAQVYDAGITDFGHGPQPFFAMELIDGQPLITYAEQQALDVRQRVQLLQSVCDAVGHAHENGVIHRDLKPSNILVDASGHPKIVDFGIARLSEAKGEPITAPGPGLAWLGTLPYSSPEQLQGGRHVADARSDVYSLGVIAFQLLAGRLPFDIEGKTVPQIIATVCQQPPRKLGTDNAEFRGDLDAVVAKTLRREVDDRYETVRAFRDDLARYLRNEPTRARPTGKLSQAFRWCAHNRAVAALAGIALVALIAGTAASSWFAVHANQTLADLRVTHVELDRHRKIAVRKRGEAEAMAAIADAKARRLRRSLFNARLLQIAALMHRSPTDALKMLDDDELCPPDLRSFTWNLLRGNSDRKMLTIATPTDLTKLAVSPNGDYLAALDARRMLRVWNTRTGLPVEKRVGASGGARCLAFSPDGKLLAAARDQTSVCIYETSDFAAVDELRGHSANLIDAEFSPDGKLLATGDSGGTVFVWDVEQDLQQRAVFDAGEAPLISVSFSPNSDELVTVSQRLDVSNWDAKTGTLLDSKAHDANKTNLAVVSPTERVLVTKRGPDEFVKVRDANDGDMVWAFETRNRLVQSLATYGEWVAVGTRDGFIELWSTRTRKRQSLFEGHNDSVTQLCFADQGRVLISAGSDRRIHFWSVTTSLSTVLCRESVRFETLMQNKRSDLLAVAGSGGTVAVCDAWKSNHAPLRELATGRSSCMTLSPDGLLVAVTKTPHGVEVRNVKSGNIVAQLETVTKGASSLLFAHDSQVLLIGGRDGTICQWDFKGNQSKTDLVGHTGEVLCLALSIDGRRLMSGSRDGSIRVWDLSSRCSTRKLAGHESWVTAVAFSPGRHLLASSGRDRVIRIWDGETGQLLRTLEGHHDFVESIAFSPDGLTLASASSDYTIRLWDPLSGDLQAVLPDHTGAVHSVLFTVDGTTLVSAGADGTIRSWPTRPQE